MKTIHNADKSQPRPKKKPKKLIRIAFSKKTTIIMLLLVQFSLILLTFTTLSWMSTYVRIVFSWLAIFLGFVIINTNENPAYKLAWIVPLIAIPVFTSVLYLILNNQYSSRRLKMNYAKKCEETKKFLKTDKALLQQIAAENRDFEKMVRYIDHFGGYPAYRNSTAVYLPFGETKFAVMLEELGAPTVTFASSPYTFVIVSASSTVTAGRVPIWSYRTTHDVGIAPDSISAINCADPATPLKRKIESSAGVLMPVGVDTTNGPVLLDVPLTLEELEGLDVPDAPVLLVFAIEDAFEEALPEPAGALLQDANRQNAIVAATTMTRCFAGTSICSNPKSQPL